MKKKLYLLFFLFLVSMTFVLYFNLTVKTNTFSKSQIVIDKMRQNDLIAFFDRDENARCLITSVDFYLISEAGATSSSSEGNIAVRLFRPCKGRWKDEGDNDEMSVGIWVPPARHGGDLTKTDFIHMAAKEGVAILTLIYPGHKFEENCEEDESGNINSFCQKYISDGYDDRGGDNTLLAIADLIHYAMGKKRIKTIGRNGSEHKFIYERLGLHSNDQINSVGMISYSGGGTTSFPTLAKHGDSFNSSANKKFKWYAGLEHKTVSGCQDSGWIRFDLDDTYDENNNGIVGDEGGNGYFLGISEDGESFEFDWDYLVFDEDEVTGYGARGDFEGLVYFGQKPFEYTENGNNNTFSSDNDKDLPIQKCDMSKYQDGGRSSNYSNRFEGYCGKCPDNEGDGVFGKVPGTNCFEDWPVGVDKWYFKNGEPSRKVDGAVEKVVYAPKIREKLEENFSSALSKYDYFASVEETNNYWRYRQMVPLISEIKEALPYLKYSISFSQWEHRQAANITSSLSKGSHPCVSILNNSLVKNGIWTRVNADSSYLVDISKKYCTMKGGRDNSYDEDKAFTPVDNKANLEMTQFNAHKMGIPVNLCDNWEDPKDNSHSRQMSFAASIIEMSDRTYYKEWGSNLSSVLRKQ